MDLNIHFNITYIVGNNNTPDNKIPTITKYIYFNKSIFSKSSWLIMLIK